MRKKEQRLWDRMRDNLAPRGIFMERIENLVGDGTPDTHTACNGVQAWVELKAVVSPPARKTTRLIPSGDGLNIDQRNWHLKYHKRGGISFVLIGVGSNVQLLLPGDMADQINDMTYDELLNESYAIDWDGIAVQLGDV